MNQRLNGGRWMLLGTYDLTPGLAQNVELSAVGDGSPIADAIALAPVDALPAKATWNFNLGSAGQYRVYARWVAGGTRATNAPFTIFHAGGQTTVPVNQQVASGPWHLLGTYDFDPAQGPIKVELTDQANGIVSADALALDPVDAEGNKATWTPTLPSAGQYKVWARWVTNSNRATNAPYTITHDGGQTTIAVDQQINNVTWVLLGTYGMTPGQGQGVKLTDRANGFVIADAVAFEPIDGPPSVATWQLQVPQAGDYRVFARWREAGDRATNAPFTIHHALGQETILVNQELPAGPWKLLGTWRFDPQQGQAKIELSERGANGYVIADAVAIEPVGAPRNFALWTPTLPAAGQYNVYARWAAHSSRASNAPFTVTHDGGQTAVVVNQRINGNSWFPLGTFGFTPGLGQGVMVTDLADGLVFADAVVFEPVQGLSATATFRPVIPSAGRYYLWGRWADVNSGVTNAPITVHHAGGASTILAAQASNLGKWVLLGEFDLAPGQDHRIVLSDHLPDWTRASDTIVADAVAIERVDAMGGTATFRPEIGKDDLHEVFLRWPLDKDAATNAKVYVTHAPLAGGATRTLTTLNQRGTRTGWVSLGVYPFTAAEGAKVEISDRADAEVMADAVKVTQVAAGGDASWSGSVAAAGTYRVMARWPVDGGLAQDARYTIVGPAGSQSMVIDQSQGGGQWNLLGEITLAANDNWRVDLSDLATGPVAADAVWLAPTNAPLADRFDWMPVIPQAGDYALHVKWVADPSRAPSALYEITHADGIDTIAVDQRAASGAADSGSWRYLGTWKFNPALGPKVSLLANGLGSVDADAIRLVSTDLAGIATIHADQLGSPRKMTDGTGAVIWDRKTRPFGETASIAGAPNAMPLRFPGQYADETGLFHNYFRDYDSSIGRYVQSDPIGLNGGINTYAYVGGNPVGRVDPWGLFESPPLLRALVPGQVAYDNAITALENGNYGHAAVHAGAWIGEAVLTVLTLGESHATVAAVRCIQPGIAKVTPKALTSEQVNVLLGMIENGNTAGARAIMEAMGKTASGRAELREIGNLAGRLVGQQRSGSPRTTNALKVRVPACGVRAVGK